jgi:hypothetical protein
MVAPILVWNSQLLPDMIVVVVMVIVEVYLLTQILPRAGPPPTITRMIIGSTSLLGSAGLLMAIIGAFLNSNLNSYSIVLLLFNFMMLGPPSVWFIAVVIFHDDRIEPRRWVWPVAIATMATVAELLMGLLFTVGNGPPYDLPSVLAGTLTSAWFLWSMVAAMLAVLFWVPLSRGVRGPLLGLAASGVVAPWVPVDPLLGASLMAAVMAATFALFFASLQDPVETDRGALRVILGVATAYLAMMTAGVVVGLLPGSTWAVVGFGATMGAVMYAEFLVLLRRGLLGPTVAPRNLPIARESVAADAPERGAVGALPP